MGKKMIIISGMHRSGTSAVAGALSLLGIDFGRHLMPAAFDNEKGYFENLDVYNVNETILSSLGSSWDSVLTLPPEWWRSGELAVYKQHIREIILREFDAGDVFAVKDPRLSRLFPLWQEVLDDLQMDYRFILPVRHPLEVALSLVKRNNFTVEKGALLWTVYNLEAERHTRAHQRIVVSYDKFLERPERFIQVLAEEFGLDHAGSGRAELPEIREFLEPALRHHRVQAGTEDFRIPAFVLTLHRHLADLSTDAGGTPSAIRAIDKTAAEFARLFNFFNASCLSQNPDLKYGMEIDRQKEDETCRPADERLLLSETETRIRVASKSRRSAVPLSSAKAWLSKLMKTSGER